MSTTKNATRDIRATGTKKNILPGIYNRRIINVAHYPGILFLSEQLFPKFLKLFMAGNVRDGTGRYSFDMFGGKKNEDGTGRDGET